MKVPDSLVVFNVKGIEIAIDERFIPPTSELAGRLRHINSMGSTSLEIKDVDPEIFAVVIEFLKTGHIRFIGMKDDGGHDAASREPTSKTLNETGRRARLLEKFFITLDMLGCLSFDYHRYFELGQVPIGFMVILQEEEWYRNHFHVEGFEYLKSDDSWLIRMDEGIYDSLKLMMLNHWRHVTHLTAKSLYADPEQHEYVEDYDQIYMHERPLHPFFNDEEELTIDRSITKTLHISSIESPSELCCMEGSVSNIKQMVEECKNKHDEFIKLRASKKSRFRDFNLLESKLTYINCITSNLEDDKIYPASYLHYGDIVTDLLSMMNNQLQWAGKFDWSNVLMAGGAVVSRLMRGLEIVNDIDLFIYGLNEEEAIAKVAYIIGAIKPDPEEIVVTRNSMTIRGDINIQIILRLYSSPSEILTGFDIDSCCVGFNGTEILATPRAMYSLKHMVNVVNLARMSPTYNYRMAKYMHRGFDVLVPGMIKTSMMDIVDRRFASEHSNCIGSQPYRYLLARELKQLSGLSYLLAMRYLRLYKEFRVPSDYETKELHSNVSFIGCKPVDKIPRSAADRGSSYPLPVNRAYVVADLPRPRLYVDDCSSNNEWRKTLGLKGKAKDTVVIRPVNEELIRSMIVWKMQNPGEQLTNTFNRTIINDPSTWYEGKYYKRPRKTNVIQHDAYHGDSDGPDAPPIAMPEHRLLSDEYASSSDEDEKVADSASDEDEKPEDSSDVASTTHRVEPDDSSDDETIEEDPDVPHEAKPHNDEWRRVLSRYTEMAPDQRNHPLKWTRETYNSMAMIFYALGDFEALAEFLIFINKMLLRFARNGRLSDLVVDRHQLDDLIGRHAHRFVDVEDATSIVEDMMSELATLTFTGTREVKSPTSNATVVDTESDEEEHTGQAVEAAEEEIADTASIPEPDSEG